MNTTIEFLNAVKTALSLTSDYQLHKVLGVTHQTISIYMLGKSFLGDETAIKVAEILNLDPAYVMACAHAERSKDEVAKQVWKDLVKRLGGVAAALLLAVCAFSEQPVYADGVKNDREYVYYVKLWKLTSSTAVFPVFPIEPPVLRRYGWHTDLRQCQSIRDYIRPL